MKLAFILFCAIAASAQAPRGAMVREANIYLSPDITSAKLGEIDRGHEVVILDTSHEWLHVEANVGPEKVITGWMLDKGVVRASTPDGDKVIYGEAVDSEDQASHSRGRHGAAQDALRLYYRVYDYFPTSLLAAQALYRFADDKWQLDKEDVMSKPSAQEQNTWMRGDIDDHWMKEVIKKYPGTKWADLAAFRLLDNKLCGDWQGQSKCPVKEADMYEKFADEHGQSAPAAQALYNAAWRWAALIEIYKTEEQPRKVEEARAKAIAIAQRLSSQFEQTDWPARGRRLLYLVQQGIPAYGNTQE